MALLSLRHADEVWVWIATDSEGLQNLSRTFQTEHFHTHAQREADHYADFCNALMASLMFPHNQIVGEHWTIAFCPCTNNHVPTVVSHDDLIEPEDLDDKPF